MYQDVRELYKFYYNTRLGVLAQKILSEKVLHFWPNTKGLTVVGYGFPLPVISSLLKDAKRGLVLMPNEQGIMAWPAAARNISLLCEETHLKCTTTTTTTTTQYGWRNVHAWLRAFRGRRRRARERKFCAVCDSFTRERGMFNEYYIYT